MKNKVLLGLFFCLILTIVAQEKPERKELLLPLNESGSHFLKATVLNQVWVRFNQNNPGSLVNGFAQNNVFDVGIRRLRIQLYGQLTDKIFLYTQFGQNNFGTQSPRFQGAFFHDALVEHKVIDRNLSIGAGLSAWGGYLRFSSPAAGSIMGLDAPLYQQPTNSTTDQFLRKLGIYAKGKLGKLDYRVMLASPMAASNSSSKLPAISPSSNFSLKPAKNQLQAYLQYQFFDEENNLTPYNAGTYYGKKRVLNIGAGFVHQADAMWHLEGKDTVSVNMDLVGVDVFYDAPISVEKGNAISLYGAYSHNNFGQNYLRANNALNPANGSENLSIISGSGNSFPMLGTGNTLFVQAGYKLKSNLLPNQGSLQIFASAQSSNFKALNEAMNLYTGGVSWLIHGNHSSKLSLALENRPVFEQQGMQAKEISRRNQLTLQLQTAF